jgi:hypothetical protein
MSYINNLWSALVSAPATVTPTKTKKAKAKRVRKSRTYTLTGYTASALRKAIDAKVATFGESPSRKPASARKSRVHNERKLKGFITTDGTPITDVLADASAAEVKAFVALGNHANPRPSGNCPKGYRFRGSNAMRMTVAAPAKPTKTKTKKSKPTPAHEGKEEYAINFKHRDTLTFVCAQLPKEAQEAIKLIRDIVDEQDEAVVKMGKLKAPADAGEAIINVVAL